MRVIARALVGVIMVACCSQQAIAEETKSKWWPFGQKKEEATVAQPPSIAAPSSPLLPPQRNAPAAAGKSTAAPTQYQAQLPQTITDESSSDGVLKSPFPKINWPKLSKPNLPGVDRLAQKSDAPTSRNTWVEPTPTVPKTSPLQSMKNGARSVGDGTRTAWHKTVDAVTPGDGKATRESRIAKREIKPPLWKRMFGAKSELQPPQTVPEWMAQQRLDP